MKKILCLSAALVMLAAGTSWAGQDITGWGKAKWGMPLVDVQKLYPGEWHPKAPPRWTALEKPKVDGKPFFVMFWFPDNSPTAKLNQVTMVTAGNPDDFDNILGLLTAKYGEYDAFERDKSNQVKVWGWSRRSGRLMFRLVEASGLGLCGISYTASSKALDNL